MTTVYAPPNDLLHIDAVWMFVSVDETGEGVCAAPIGDALIPLIAADEARLELLKPIARTIARESGKLIKLIKLSQRTEVMSIAPDGGDMQ